MQFSKLAEKATDTFASEIYKFVNGKEYEWMYFTMEIMNVTNHES